jgi:tetratricopeptide (TPR) repeat protein
VPLGWLKRRFGGRPEPVATEPRVSPVATSAAADLRFKEAPSLIRAPIASADYQAALHVLERELAGQSGATEPEMAFWRVQCLTELGELEEALEVAESALDDHPEVADLYLAQARIHQHRGNSVEREEALSMAQHYAPASTAVLNMLGDLSREKKDNKGAISYYAESLGLQYSARTAMLLASAYSESDMFEESEKIIREALDRFPDDYHLLGNLGRLLTTTDRYEDAIEILHRLADLPVLDIQLWADLTYVHYCFGELKQAEYYVRKILSIEPSNYGASYYLGLIQLARGEFSEAWENYRWRMLASMKHGRHYSFPDWEGTPSPERTLLIFAEQGLGDQIMFSGCLPEVLDAGQRVLLECDERLTELFARSFPQARVVPWAKHRRADWTGDVGEIDCQIAMGDLPGLYRRSVDSFPDHGGYLKPDPSKVARWRTRLAELGEGSRIGISWRGGTVKTRRSIRSIEPEDWEALLAIPDAHFISLQYGDVDEDLKTFSEIHGVRIHHWQEAIDDYDETAALVAALDGVSTVCTAIAHLTGALGQRGWVATPVIPEWRYMTGGRRWLWYPQMTLVRQEQLGEWGGVMAEIARDVSAHCRRAC